MEYLTCFAEVGFWCCVAAEVCFWYVAVSASADGVGVVVGEGFLGDAGVVAEDAFWVESEGVFSEGDGLVVGCGCGLAGEDLDDVAAAVPSVAWIEVLPEGVGDGECDSFEAGVFGADAVVACCAVLEEVAVAVLCVLFPFCCHGGGGGGEVVFCGEVLFVVGFVDVFDFFEELCEWFSGSVGVEQ